MRHFLVFGVLLTLGCADASGHDQTSMGGATDRGGTSATGGSSAAGGMVGTGGRSATGGSSPTGGSSATANGGATGGSNGSGGAAIASSDAGLEARSRADGSSADSSSSGGKIGSEGDTSSGGNSGSGGGAGSGTGGSTTSSTCRAPQFAQAPSGVTPMRAIDGFVTRTGTTLSLCGTPFQVFGGNLYYLQSYSVYEAGNLRTVADGLDDAVRMSLPVVRTWAFNDSKDTNDTATIRSAPDTYLERGLVGLDTVVAEAKKRGIRLIMTLSNYWDAYGGFPRYATWAGASGADDFYTNTTMQGYLKDYANKLSQRVNTLTGIAYKDEPTILAWEIANEMRCKTCTDASEPVAAIDNLSKFLKTVFPNHLIADGGEGFDDTPSNWGPLSNTYPVSGYEHVSYSKIAQLSALDMLSYHYYPDPNYWNLTITDSATVASDAKSWIDGHAALAKAGGKVAYWGEFGIDGLLSTTDRDAARAPIYDNWLSSFFATIDNNSVATFWQLVPQSRGADDGFACIVGRDPKTVAVFENYSQPRAPRGN